MLHAFSLQQLKAEKAANEKVTKLMDSADLLIASFLKAGVLQDKDFGSLLLLATSAGNADMVGKLAETAAGAGQNNVSFLSYSRYPGMQTF